jgi:deoxyribodipyrimidine photolyase-related protein
MPSHFRTALDEINPTDEGGRTWVFVPYDQLSDAIGPLSRLPADEAAIVLVESLAKAHRRPYHKRKLALILGNLRHFALEQARRGVHVRHVATRQGYAEALREVAEQTGPLRMMRAAERELRHELGPLIDDGLLCEEPHEGWLTTADDFASAGPAEGPWRMDSFYRAVRKRTGLLMDDDGRPLGGKYSHDADNRKTWSGDPPQPELPDFPSDPVKDEVVALVHERFPHHPGRLDPGTLPVTADDAHTLWDWAFGRCLEHFGPYEDAMSHDHRRLFHTKTSELLHLHRLLPRDVVREVAEADDLPLNSREGFVRQVIGWREYVRHVHEATDGFRTLAGTDDAAGDGGYRSWKADEPAAELQPDGFGGATPSALDSHDPVPPAFWGTPSGLECLDRSVADVWHDGWGHHIPRLMVLSNLATLLDVSPRALADWFWVAYADAYDWVVEPNVLGMGTFGAGEVMTTKPYVSGSNYLHKMSDHCDHCAFHPKKTCPITGLYWAFLERKRAHLQGNHRLSLPLASAAKRSEARQQADADTFERVRSALQSGERLTPDP